MGGISCPNILGEQNHGTVADETTTDTAAGGTAKPVVVDDAAAGGTAVPVVVVDPVVVVKPAVIEGQEYLLGEPSVWNGKLWESIMGPVSAAVTNPVGSRGADECYLFRGRSKADYIDDGQLPYFCGVEG